MEHGTLSRFTFGLAFVGLTTLAIGCGSSDTPDSGQQNPPKDTGVVTPGDTGTTTGDTGGTNGDTGSTNVDGGSGDTGRRDATPGRDATATPIGDAGTTYTYGTKVLDPPANLIGVTPDESEIFFTDSTSLKAVAPTGGAVKTIQAMPDNLYNVGKYSFITTDTGGTNDERATLKVYRTGTSSAIPMSTRFATDIIGVSPDSEIVVFADNVTGTGTTQTSSRTGDIIIARSDRSSRMTLFTQIDIGVRAVTDNTTTPPTTDWIGPCSPQIIFTSSTAGFFAGCRDNANNTRTISYVDFTTGQVSPLPGLPSAAGRIPTVYLASPRLNYILIQEYTSLSNTMTVAQFFGATKTGMNLIPLVENMQTVTSQGCRMGPCFLFNLDANRFGYRTGGQEIRVASYPRMMPTTIQDLGAALIKGVSPAGNAVMFSSMTDDLYDINIVSTSTAGGMPAFQSLAMRNGYAAESPFSEDGAYAFWYANVNGQFIGDLMGRSVEANAQPVMLGSGGYYFLTYRGTPNNVFMMINTRFEDLGMGATRAVGDYAIRPRDGSMPIKTIVGGVTTEFILFPTTNRMVYTSVESTSPGIFVRNIE